MTDFTSDVRASHAGQSRSFEYGLYFVLVFALSLPGALVRSLVAAAHGDFAGPGLLRRAQARAREITPTIFDA